MHITTSHDAGCLLLTVEDDRIDAAVAVEFKDRIRDLTGTPDTRIILNLANVDFVDSSGLGAIVGSMKQLGSKKRMDLAGLTPTVEKVFRMTRMDKVFRIYPDSETAFGDIANAS